jgi:flagellum-specific peptidoglycan hydrolase FlgJ
MATTHNRIITAACLALASITLAVGEDGNSSSSSDNKSSSSSDNKSSSSSDDKSSSSSDNKSSSSSDDKSSNVQSNAVSNSQASPIQSLARPYNLNIVAPVQLAGSDAASKAFQTNVLPGLVATELKLLNRRSICHPSRLIHPIWCSAPIPPRGCTSSARARAI